MLVSKSVRTRQNDKDSINGIEPKDEEDPGLNGTGKRLLKTGSKGRAKYLYERR
jgi:hypothetical protein